MGIPYLAQYKFGTQYKYVIVTQTTEKITIEGIFTEKLSKYGNKKIGEIQNNHMIYMQFTIHLLVASSACRLLRRLLILLSVTFFLRFFWGFF